MQEKTCAFSEIYYPSCDGRTNIHACIWQPTDGIRAAVQIVHGMAEYAKRYDDFARYLAGRGVLVFAQDHLGHGKSVTSPDNVGYFAAERGCMPLIRDIRTLAENVKSRFPDVPYFMFGHSMGSFLCRNYISLYGRELAGAVIMGTGFKGSATVWAGKALCTLTSAFRGWSYRPPLIEKIAFMGYNSRFGGRTRFDWLSSRRENVDAYIADDMCGIPFTCNGFYGLFDAIGKCCARRTMAATPDNLPLFVLSGSDDPVGDYGKGVRKVCDIYRRMGKDVQMKLYEGCRHELLSEFCADDVMGDIYDFICRHSGGEGGAEC